MKCKGCNHEEKKGFMYKDKFYCDDCCADLFDELCRDDFLEIKPQTVNHFYYGDGDYMGSDEDLDEIDVMENISLNNTEVKRINEVQDE